MRTINAEYIPADQYQYPPAQLGGGHHPIILQQEITVTFYREPPINCQKVCNLLSGNPDETQKKG